MAQKEIEANMIPLPTVEYKATTAVRSHIPLILTVTGYAGAGKTMSGLRLCAGIQKVIGGEIYGIDTESGRMLQYADYFKFKHVNLEPQSALHFQKAIEDCYKAGARIIFIDSMSDEHEAMLDAQETYLWEKCGDDWRKRDKYRFTSLIRPKAERKQLIRRIMQMTDVAFVLTYRAQDKIRPVIGGDPQKLGWQPITTSPLVYASTVRFLLAPGADGKPKVHSDEKAEAVLIKNPDMFRAFIKEDLQLSEELGERIARWAQGGQNEAPEPPKQTTRYNITSDVAKVTPQRIGAMLEKFKSADVMPQMIEAYLGHDVSDLNELELVQLREIYRTINDGSRTWASWMKEKV